MSGKRFNPLEDPPSASSSDEDDQVKTTSLPGNSSSEDETDDESSKNPSSNKPESAPEKQQVSNSDSGSDEETDSDSQTVRVKKNPGSSSDAKSIAGTKDSAVVKNHDSKKVKPLTKKRSLSETDGAAAAASKEAKKVKSGGSGEEAKKTYFQRVWSEEDEIAVLQGLIDYRNDTGASPYDDTNAFYLSVKKSISFDVSKTQVIKKIWGLKTKYENNLVKEELTFSKPHDRKAFDLSKFVWGADAAALDSASKKSSKSSSKKVEPEKQELASSSSPNGKSCEEEAMTNKGEASSVVEVDAFDKSVLVKALARFGVDDLSAQRGWSRLALEDKKRFEEEWKTLQLRELEFYSKKSGFIHEVITKMAESFPPNP
ncbi:BnaCnng18000D [Brassica napus]|uniref:BnaCnng18000D protein n=1 Tax=Brassica napus TaxID=3708 RepID=A0A078IIM9_BRANA|nr:BnaCnng18000D [Brassica napus]